MTCFCVVISFLTKIFTAVFHLHFFTSVCSLRLAHRAGALQDCCSSTASTLLEKKQVENEMNEVQVNKNTYGGQTLCEKSM